MQHAIAQLEVALRFTEDNARVRKASGNAKQARIDRWKVREFKRAIAVLTALADPDSAPIICQAVLAGAVRTTVAGSNPAHRAIGR